MESKRAARRQRHERLWRFLGYMWAAALLLCPPLVVWADVCDGHEAWRQVMRHHEMTERRVGVLVLSLVGGVVGEIAVGGTGTMLGWLLLVVCGAGAGWVMSRPYRRTIMTARRGQEPVAAVREAVAEVERVLADARR